MNASVDADLRGELARILAVRPETLTLEPFVSGNSNEILWASTKDDEYAVRLAPPGPMEPGRARLSRDYSFLTFLYNSGYPVPEPIAHGDISSREFILMRRVGGRTLSATDVGTDGSGSDKPEISLVARASRALRTLHRYDWRGSELEGFARPEPFTQRQLRRWRTRWVNLQDDGGRSLPAVQEVGDWLDQHVPKKSDDVIVHGDYGLHNILWSEDDQVSGVLDWEMASIGSAYSDLGWFIVLTASSMGLGSSRLLDVERVVVSSYADGNDLGALDLASVRYFEVFAAWKWAVIGEGNYLRFLKGRSVNPRAAMMEEDVPKRIGIASSLLTTIASEGLSAGTAWGR